MQYTRLTREERFTIATLQTQGLSLRSIAKVLERSPSTISREVSTQVVDKQGYNYEVADEISKSRRCRKGKLYSDWSKVEQRLKEGWSPEQITGYYRLHGEQVPSHETIYQYILENQKKGGDLHTNLRHRLKSYRKRGMVKERRGQIKNQVMIDERPQVVDDKTRIGDWELDTVIGRSGGHVLVTMVERYSRYTLIRKAQRKGALEVGSMIFDALHNHKDKTFTLTADNGKEFAGHALLANLLECSVYFAHPYSSWERGLNENTNGLIRQYLPKKTCFNHLSEKEIQRIENALNSRPRKCLAFKTPNDIFRPPQGVALGT